ncbi:MAG: phosphoribosyl transferase [Acidobacteria bacterium]|nr:MAG: phosphoribosyl transferase [Acidobacteriota bacterium]
MRFRDRIHAGQLLAAQLSKYIAAPDVLVCALPRGGVVVGFQVAEVLRSALDIVVVRKLGVPGQKELAMGAIASGGIRVLRHDLIEELEISDRVLETIVAEEERELERREAIYRGGAPPPEISGRTIILVDDGLATGATMWAAAVAVRQQQPKRLVIAVPVAPPSTCTELSAQADEIVCISRPALFAAIGEFYEDFHQVSDEEVKDLLRRAASRTSRKLA